MKNFEKYITIKNLAELFAYEIYYTYNIDKEEIKNLDHIYNSIASHLEFTQYKNEIIELGKVMAKILYEIKF